MHYKNLAQKIFVFEVEFQLFIIKTMKKSQFTLGLLLKIKWCNKKKGLRRLKKT